MPKAASRRNVGGWGMGLGFMALPSASARNPYAKVITMDTLGAYPAPELASGTGKIDGSGWEWVRPALGAALRWGF